MSRKIENAKKSNVAAFEQTLEDAPDVLSRSRPAPNANDDRTITRILGPQDPTLDDQYTAQTEQEVQDEWGSSPFHAFLARIAADTRVRLPTGNLAVWKTCVRLFEQTPLAIVSPARFLVWETDHGQANAWQDDFCRRLKTLCVQPLFHHESRQGWRMIPIFLQFAVICRTGDVRPWDFEWPGSCAVMEELSRQAKTSSSVPMAQRHAALRYETEKKGKIPGRESDVLMCLGSLVQPESGANPSWEGPRPLYRLRTRDVTAVVNALNSYKGPVGAVFGSAETNELAFDVANTTSAPSGGQLISWIKRSYISQLRVKKRNLLPPTPTTADQAVQTEPSESFKTVRRGHLRPAHPQKRRRISSISSSDVSGVLGFGHGAFDDRDEGVPIPFDTPSPAPAAALNDDPTDKPPSAASHGVAGREIPLSFRAPLRESRQASELLTVTPPQQARLAKQTPPAAVAETAAAADLDKSAAQSRSTSTTDPSLEERIRSGALPVNDGDIGFVAVSGSGVGWNIDTGRALSTASAPQGRLTHASRRVTIEQFSAS